MLKSCNAVMTSTKTGQAFVSNFLKMYLQTIKSMEIFLLQKDMTSEWYSQRTLSREFNRKLLSESEMGFDGFKMTWGIAETFF